MLADSAENQLLAKKYGLYPDEMEAFRENFIFSDADGNGNISEDELNKLLKNLGYEPTTRIQRESLENCLTKLQTLKVQLDFNGIVRLVIDYYDDCANTILGKYRAEMTESGIRIDQLSMMFYEMGLYISRTKVNKLMLAIGVDVETLGEYIEEDVFKKVIEECRIERLYQWRATYGFKDDEIIGFKNAFEENCEKGTNMLDMRSLPNVVRELGYDEVFESDKGHVIQQRVEASLHGDTKVSWDRFLHMLKQLENIRKKKQLQEEKEAAEQLGLNDETYDELKKVFQGYDEKGSGKISKGDIRSLFGKEAKTQEQRKGLRKTLEEFPGDGLDFMQFMAIFQQLNSSGEY